MKYLLVISTLLLIGCKGESAPASAPPATAKTVDTVAPAAAPAPAPAAAPASTCAPIKAGIAVGTTLDALQAAYGDELHGFRVSDNDASGDYVVGPDDAPCIRFAVAYVKDNHRVTKITTKGGAQSATLDVSRAVKSLSEIVGVAVGEKGATAMPSCCLDCDALVPELQKLAQLASDLGAPAGATELRAASTKVRAAPWATILEGTGYDEKLRTKFVERMDNLASELETAATALDGSSDAAPHAKKIAAGVDNVVAVARVLGKASREYCAHD